MGLERMSTGSNHGLFFILLLFFFCVKLCSCTIFCPEIEKQSLVEFKQSLEDPGSMLSSWNVSSEENCCKWRGVVCSNSTGHVHQLHLQGSDPFEGSLRGKVNPSVVNLKQLKHLDLSQNYFGITIPSFLGLLSSLEYLNLSYAGFHGRIPPNIGNLTNLRRISLEDYEGWGDLRVDGSMEWLSGLSRLEYLNMNSVNLSKAENWVQVINTLPSLGHLHLSYCSLNSLPPSLPHVNTTSLATLDLSHNNFSSFQMPTWLSQLPSLVELYLSSCDFKAPLAMSDVNTTSLSTLDLSYNDFESFVMPTWIFQLPNLVFLDLNGCLFKGPIPSISNTTKLKYIDLSHNNINSSIPDWLYFCKHLEHVSLMDSNLHNTISDAIGNLTSLNTLYLSSNRLSGNIPREIASLCKIQVLYLFENMLQGDVSDSFGNMSDCFLDAVKDLVLNSNQLYGHLTRQFGEFKSLETLDLGSNSISGTIPINIGDLSSLETLLLANNKLSGNLPESMGQLHNLKYMLIEHNMLEGMVAETHFSNLSKLYMLSASGNHLNLKVSSNWVPPFTLRTLLLGSWDLGVDHIPSWIETQKSVIDLDLSNTGVSGNIPAWIWEIGYLNLSHNNFLGQIPHIGPLKGQIPSISEIPRVVFLSSNKFNGSLPRIANDVDTLDLSNNSFTTGLSTFLCDTTNQTNRLRILHLEGNQLIGELPDCLMKWPSLTLFNLASNNLSGNIPNSIRFLAHLMSFNLHGNKFSGQIPFALHNCTNLLKLDLGGNEFAGNIPAWIGTSLTVLKYLILRSNKLSGEIPSDICILNALQILDLSNNAFSGVIPKCVHNFTSMATKRSLDEQIRYEPGYPYFGELYLESASVATKGREYEYDTILSLVTNIDLSNNNLSGVIPKELTSLVELESLNLSGNHLIGSIPDSMGDMRQMESLDLSRNSLSGEIPNNFTLMCSLSYLDLSFNNLTGRIPSSTQLQSMNASSFAGNHLCGPPLPNHCSNGGDPPVVVAEDEESKVEWIYIFLSLGYAVGLSAWCTALILKKSWRDAYFGMLECIWNKVYVYFCIKWRSLTQAPTS